MSDVTLNDVLGKGWRKPPFVNRAWLRWPLTVGFVAYMIAAFMTIEVDWGRVYEGLDRGAAFVLAFTSPVFTFSRFPQYQACPQDFSHID